MSPDIDTTKGKAMLAAKKHTLALAKVALLLGPPPSNGGTWTADDLSFNETKQFIGRSFAGTEKHRGEPTVDFLGDHITFPTPEDKVQTLCFFVSLFLSEAFSRRHVTFAKKLDSGAVASVVLIREYSPVIEGGWWTKLTDKAREQFHTLYLLISGGIPEFVLAKKNKKDIQGVETQWAPVFSTMHRCHKELGPKQTHWYVNIVATEPDHQGQGHGTEIMTRVSELADAEHMDCYLEAGDERNKQFYERFGYEVVGTSIFENKVIPKGRTCTMFHMVRLHK